MGGSLDTNALLRLLLNDIPEQHQAIKELLAKGSFFSVADIAIIELVFVLERYYGFSRTQVAEAVTGLAQLKGITCNRVLFEKALPVYTEHSALSFEDCYLATCAVLGNAEPLWTFDKKLARQLTSARSVKL
jgi:predicted nucleic-acid-binding protein